MKTPIIVIIKFPLPVLSVSSVVVPLELKANFHLINKLSYSHQRIRKSIVFSPSEKTRVEDIHVFT
jgi:hypothetical protein